MKDLETIGWIAALLPVFIMVFIGIICGVIMIPMLYMFVSDLHAPFLITVVGYIAVTGVILFGIVVFLGFVVSVVQKIVDDE